MSNLDPNERAFLSAVDRLTRNYGDTDGEAVANELAGVPGAPPEELLYDLSRRLRDGGYIDYQAGGGMRFRSSANMSLTRDGREEVREFDSVERVHAEARHVLASEAFTDAYPDAFKPWAEAERLLRTDNASANLTTIGHLVRDAMQAFATALVDEHEPPGVVTNPTLVEKRLA